MRDLLSISPLSHFSHHLLRFRLSAGPTGQPLALWPQVDDIPPYPSFFFLTPCWYLLTCRGYRGNEDIPQLSLLAISLQDTSNAIGVTEVRQSCSRLREVIQVWSETERKAGAASIDGIIAAHGQLKRDFTIAKSWLTRYVETGNVPDDGAHSAR